MPYKDPARRAEYNRSYQRKYYQSQKDNYRKRAKKRRQKIRAWFNEYRRNCECENCGLSGEECAWLIEFHHRNPDEKEDEVSFLVSSGYSIERIKKEMAKCATLCPNCHRLHHWNEKIETGKSVYSKSATKRKPLGNHKTNTARRKRKQRERNARKKAKSDKKN